MSGLSIAIVTGVDDSFLWVAVGLLLLLGIALGSFLASQKLRRRMARNRRLGSKGEEIAMDLLERAGFEIVEVQPTSVALADVDGIRRSFELRADALVRKRGQDFLVEIKGTNASADLSNRATRRQLLEYATAYDVEACLLVNAERGTIQVVSFPALGSEAP